MTDAGHGGPRTGSGRKKLPAGVRAQRKKDRAEDRALRAVLSGKFDPDAPKAVQKGGKVALLPMEMPEQRRRSGWTTTTALQVVSQSRAMAKVIHRKPELNPFQIPQHPPLARPQDKKLLMAMDESMSWAAQNWSEFGAVYGAVGTEGLQFLGYPYLSELTQRPEYRVISETRADDATRKWIDFDVVGTKEADDDRKKQQREESAIRESGQRPDPEEQRGRRDDRVKKSGKSDKVKALRDEMERLGLRDHMYTICRDDGFFGRSHLFLDTGDQIETGSPNLAVPIGDGRDAASKAAVPKNGLKEIRTVEAVWAYPTTYNAINPLQKDWYNPQVWYVMGTQIHSSRLLRFVGSPVPDLLKPAYSFGGLSLSQLAKPYVDIWLRTRQSVGQLIHSFSVMVLMTDLATMLQPGSNTGAAEILARVAAFNALRDNQGTFVLNKNTEDFKNVSASLAGLHELQSQAQEHMMSVARIPDVKFTGINPSGLNASSEGVLQAYYDTIAAYQNRFIRPNLTRVINFMQLSLFGEIDPEISFEFEALWELTEKERADLQKTEAERDQVYVDMGALSNEEVRKRIIDDPHLPYADLNPEDVPELKQEEQQGLIPPDAGKGLEAVLGDPSQKGGAGAPGGGGGPQGGPGAPQAPRQLPKPQAPPSSGAGAFGHDDSVGKPDPIFAFDAWEEGDHPRGQPDNAGEFASAGSGSGPGKSKPAMTFGGKGDRPGFEAPRPAPLDPKALERVGPQLGSNPGGVFEDKAGTKFYVKAGRSRDHVRNELTAAALMGLAGAPTLRYRDVDGGRHVATEMEKLGKDNASKLSPAEVARARQDFAAHAWLANYDAVGTGGDNLATIHGVPTCVDLGGALDYRARGAPKGSTFGDKVTELDSMRDPSIAPDASKIFGGMTPAELQESALRVTSIGDDEIRGVVDEMGGKPDLADKLIARKNDIAERAKTFGEEGDPAKPKSTVVFAKGKDSPAGELNGVKFERWSLPAGTDWNDVPGQADLDETPLPAKMADGRQLASGIVIREPDGRIWLTRPKRGYGGYANTFPKGRVEPGLSMQANAIKEAFEETGLKAKIVGVVGDHNGDVTTTRYYLGERTGGDPADAGEESDGVVLAPHDRLAGLLNRKRDRDIADGLMAHDAAPLAPRQVPDETKRERGAQQETFGRHVAEEIDKASPREKVKYAKHVAAAREFFSSDGARRATARAVAEFVQRRRGGAQRFQETALVPLVHHVAERAVELAGVAPAIDGSALAASAVAAHAAHHLLDAAGLATMAQAKELLTAALRGMAGSVAGTREIADQVTAVGRRALAQDAGDTVTQALVDLLTALDQPGGDDGGGAKPAMAADAEWQEAQHPRDKSGKFAESAGGGGSSPEATAIKDKAKKAQPLGTLQGPKDDDTEVKAFANAVDPEKVNLVMFDKSSGNPVGQVYIVKKGEEQHVAEQMLWGPKGKPQGDVDAFKKAVDEINDTTGIGSSLDAAELKAKAVVQHGVTLQDFDASLSPFEKDQILNKYGSLSDAITSQAPSSNEGVTAKQSGRSVYATATNADFVKEFEQAVTDAYLADAANIAINNPDFAEQYKKDHPEAWAAALKWMPSAPKIDEWKTEAGIQTSKTETPAAGKKTKFGGLWKEGGDGEQADLHLNANSILSKPAFAGQSYRQMLAFVIKGGEKFDWKGQPEGAEKMTALKTKLAEALYMAQNKAISLGKPDEASKIAKAIEKIQAKEPTITSAAWQSFLAKGDAGAIAAAMPKAPQQPEPKPAPQSKPFPASSKLFQKKLESLSHVINVGPPADVASKKAKLAAQNGAGVSDLVDNLTIPENQALKDKYGSISNALAAKAKDVAEEAEAANAAANPAPGAPASKASPAGATEAELSKAKKTNPLQLQYVPNAPQTPDAQKLVDEFNSKWGGKDVPDDNAALQKIADFKALQQKMEPLMSAAQKDAAEQNAKIAAEAAKSQSDKAAKIKADAAKHEAELVEYKKELGISDVEASGFEGLVEMLGKDKNDVINEFKKSDVQAGHGISKFEGSLIRAYKQNSSIVNKEMRKSEASWTEPQVMFAKVLNKSLAKLPGFKGVTIRNTPLSADLQMRYQPGKIVFEHGFTGTSKVKPDGIFDGNTRFYVTGIGGRGGDIANMHGFEGEQEVLYQAHTMFKVDKVEGQVGGQGKASYKVWMTEVAM